MSGLRVEGNVSGNVAEVDAANQLKVVPEIDPLTNPASVGAVKAYAEVDAGSITGTPTLRSARVSANMRQRVGVDTVLFNDTFNALTQNTSLWNYIFVTLTASQPGAGTVNFGTVQGTAATHGALMRTYQHFPVLFNASLRVEATMGLFTATLVANEEWRFGLGLPTVAGTAPTDGIFFLLTTAGLIGTIVYNGVTTQTGALATLASFIVGSLYRLSIIINERQVEFWRENVLLGTLATPVANGQPFQGAALPFFMQKLCTGAVSNTNTVRVSDVGVHLTDLASNKTWNEQLSTAGQSGNLGQNGHTQGKTSLWGNSAAPTAVALSNTAAAFVGLGGIGAVLPTLAVSSDGILFSFQNPVPTINITGRNLLVYGVTVESHVSVVLSAAAVIIYECALAYGHTAVSLATAETGSFITATTHAPRIVPLGTILYTVAVAAPAATRGNGLNVRFTNPIIVRPGEFVQIILRLGVGGVVTATGAITFLVNYDSVWE